MASEIISNSSAENPEPENPGLHSLEQEEFDPWRARSLRDELQRRQQSKHLRRPKHLREDSKITEPSEHQPKHLRQTNLGDLPQTESDNYQPKHLREDQKITEPEGPNSIDSEEALGLATSEMDTQPEFPQETPIEPPQENAVNSPREDGSMPPQEDNPDSLREDTTGSPQEDPVESIKTQDSSAGETEPAVSELLSIDEMENIIGLLDSAKPFAEGLLPMWEGSASVERAYVIFWNIQEMLDESHVMFGALRENQNSEELKALELGYEEKTYAGFSYAMRAIDDMRQSALGFLGYGDSMIGQLAGATDFYLRELEERFLMTNSIIARHRDLHQPSAVKR